MFLLLQQFPESDVIPITTAEQDSCEHSTSDDFTQQHLYDGSYCSGQIAFSQLEIEMWVIINFNAENSTEFYQQWRDLLEDFSSPTLPSLVSSWSQ